MLLHASGAVTGLSAKWVDVSFTALQVNWDPVTAANEVKYRITYSYMPRTTECADDNCGPELLGLGTQKSTVILKKLNSDSFYSLSVHYESNDAENMVTLLPGKH